MTRCPKCMYVCYLTTEGRGVIIFDDILRYSHRHEWKQWLPLVFVTIPSRDLVSRKWILHVCFSIGPPMQMYLCMYVSSWGHGNVHTRIPVPYIHTCRPHTAILPCRRSHSGGAWQGISRTVLHVLFVCHYLLSVISLFKVYTLYDIQIVIVQYSIYREN